MRIYVAGKYNDTNILNILNNMREGIRASVEVLKKGHACFCPWLDYLFQFFEPTLSIDDYYNYSMAWLEVSDAVLALPSWIYSSGAGKEIARAKELGLIIYHSLEDIPKVENGGSPEVEGSSKSIPRENV